MPTFKTVRERRYKSVPLSEIYVDDFQREIEPRAEKIAEQYDPAKLDPPLINLRPGPLGQYSLTDGLHRVTALQDTGADKTTCAIIKVPLEDEIELFLHQYDNSRRISPLSMFNARVAGGLPQYVAIKNICQRSGFYIPSRSQPVSQARPRDIVLKTASGIQDVFRYDKTGDILSEDLNYIYGCWFGSPDAGHHDLTRGMGLVVRDYGDVITPDVLTTWGQASARTILDAARDKGAQSTRALAVAERLRTLGRIRKRKLVSF